MTITRLDDHYRFIRTYKEEVQHEYPFENSYVDDTGSRTRFTYTERISNTFVFRAVSETKEDLIIKFTKRYSESAHRFLADLGHAPNLKAINVISDGWQMIVMDSSPYIRLYDLNPILNNTTKLAIKQKVKDVTEKLHLKDIVHGDIRQANILVDKITLGSCPEGICLHLIDFDWAGKVGTAEYPMEVNTQTVQRPADVAGGTLVTKSHDLQMIDLLFSS